VKKLNGSASIALDLDLGALPNVALHPKATDCCGAAK
jgi:hypothetical protein